MVGRTVPSGTVIDSESRTVDPERLRQMPFSARRLTSMTISSRSEPSIGSIPAWPNWHAPGWPACRKDGHKLKRSSATCGGRYVHDRLATAAPGSIDVVADFLLGSRRGPDYLFASAAVVLLRSLGYPARLVSGLYAAPDRFDPRTRHTAVTSEDVHVWAEVRLPNGIWIAVEPTPGYELLPPAVSWSELIVKILNRMGHWVNQHGNFLLVASSLLAALIGWRRHLLDGLGARGIRALAGSRAEAPGAVRSEARRTACSVGRLSASSGPDTAALVSPRQPRWPGRAREFVAHADRCWPTGLPMHLASRVAACPARTLKSTACVTRRCAAGRSIASASLSLLRRERWSHIENNHDDASRAAKK